VVGVNLFFGALHPSLIPPLPMPLASLAVNAVLFLVPAFGWLGFLRAPTRALGMRLTAFVGISTGAFLAVVAILQIAHTVPTQALAWNLTWLVTNLGFLAQGLPDPAVAVRRSLAGREVALGILAFVTSYGLYYWGATRVVPPQDDHDLEVQATGYGLLTRFEPLLLTDRQTIYYFAHPPLLHLYVAGSFLYHGTFPALEVFDAASRRARDAREQRPFEPFRGPVLLDKSGTRVVIGIEPPDYLLAPTLDGAATRLPIEKIELALIYDRYRQQPYRLETRTPNLFFAAATVALLAIWAGRISRRRWMGFLMAVAYATNPEVFVRSSYGGYFAVGAFTTTLMLLAAEHWRRWPRWSRAGSSVTAGVLAALSDHKMVLLPAAAVVHAIGIRLKRAALHPVALGFGLGVVLFWCWGMAIAPAAFLEDHFHHHLIDRITHLNPLGYHDYPTTAALWWEFVKHSAYILLPAGLVAMIYDIARARSRPSPGARPLRGLWLLWTVSTAVAFSVVDWRMTKHLMPMLLALHLGLVPDRTALRWRTASALLVLLFILAWNVWELTRLAADFPGFQITPAW